MLYSKNWYPPRSTIEVLWRGKPLYLRLENGRVDLSDTIMLKWWRAQRTVELRLKTKSTKWEIWDEASMKNVEAWIRYDLNFDCYGVTIKRLSGQGNPCSTEMCWKLIVRPRS